MEAGQARDILLYNKYRVFAFVLALGEVDDLKYATAAGAINFGFPVIADTRIPQILPTGVTTYEHVVTMPFDEIPGADDMERAEKLVQRCIEVRGVKVKIAKVPIPVPYGSAFEGERVRKDDMHVEFGGKRTRAFEYLRMRPADEVEDGKIDVVGPDFDDVPTRAAPCRWASWSRWPAARCSPTSSRSSSARSTTSSTAPRASSTSASATSPGSASATAPSTRASACEHLGKILHARIHDDVRRHRRQGAGDALHRRGRDGRAGWTRRARPTTSATSASPT